MHGRQQELLAADRIHLLADDLADLLVHTPAQREHGVVAGLELAHEAATDQQAVAGRLGLGRGVAESGYEQVRPTHRPGLLDGGRGVGTS